MTWLAVNYIRREFSAPTKRIDNCIYSLRCSVSGGTFASATQAFDNYSLLQIYRIHAPYAMSPKRPNPTLPPKPTSLWTKLFGLFKVRELGWLGYQPQGPIDRAIVHRSWGLLADTPESYGPNFDFHTWFHVWGPLSAIVWHWSLITLIFLFLLKPIRWLLSRVWYQPGDGSRMEKLQLNRFEYRCVAEADTTFLNAEKQENQKALVKLRYEGDPYLFTAVTLAEAAKIILRQQGTEAHKIGGGILTPATLGSRYVNSLREGGVLLEVGRNTQAMGNGPWSKMK